MLTSASPLVSRSKLVGLKAWKSRVGTVVGVVVGVADGMGVADGVDVGVAVGDGVKVGVEVGVGVGVGVSVGVGLCRARTCACSCLSCGMKIENSEIRTSSPFNICPQVNRVDAITVLLYQLAHVG